MMPARLVLLAGLLLAAVAAAAAGVFPALPEFDGTPAIDAPRPEGGSIGTLRLAVGSVDILAADGKRYSASTGTALFNGDAIRTSGASRARLELTSGDLINVAPQTILRVESDAVGPRATLWRGRTMVYALPGIGGRPHPLTLSAASGRLALRAGKVLVESGASGTAALVFDGRAQWEGVTAAEPSWLGSGQGWSDHPEAVAARRFSPEEEARATQETSPATAALQEGLKAYTARDTASARRWFEAVQKAYPFDPTAAYYLGLMAMEQHENRLAAQQFGTVAQANPEFAAKNDLPQHMTLLVAQALGEEVKTAIANEQSISTQPPEANSVAVQPFGNQGDPKYRALSKGLTAMVVSDLAKVPNLKVLERQKLQKLEDELRLSKSGLVDADTAVRVGRLMKSEKMLLGDYLIGPRP